MCPGGIFLAGGGRSPTVIEYPDDRPIAEQASAHALPEPVLVRDLVRVVEVLNLKNQGFFSKDSVLAGSMALRCFGSPRFTVYDADFSTSSQTVDPPTAMKKMLNYRDDELEITAADLVPHDQGGTAWKSAPITFEPVFTSLVPNAEERTFKADVSFRGLLLPGWEVPLLVPYDLDIWQEEPLVFVMDPHETVAEKILGWCVHRNVKHYADLAYIALVSQAEPPARPSSSTTERRARLRQPNSRRCERFNPIFTRRFQASMDWSATSQNPRSSTSGS